MHSSPAASAAPQAPVCTVGPRPRWPAPCGPSSCLGQAPSGSICGPCRSPVVPRSPLRRAHAGKTPNIPNRPTLTPFPGPEASRQKGIGTVSVCRPSLSQTLGNTEQLSWLLWAQDHPPPRVPLSPARARGLTTDSATDQGRLGGGRRREKSMHVNRVGNLFSSLEQGLYNEARRETESYKHISAIFLRGPFLD